MNWVACYVEGLANVLGCGCAVVAGFLAYFVALLFL
jgi:hypothetical protein